MMPPLKKYPLVAQLLILLGLFLINNILFSLLAVSLSASMLGADYVRSIITGSINNDTDRLVLLFVQGMASVGAFIFTSLVFNYTRTGSYTKYLGLNNKVLPVFLPLMLLAVLSIQPLVGYLIDLNKAIPLPGFLSFLSEREEANVLLTEQLTSFTSISQLLATVLVMAVVPAIGEELLFRGVLMRRFMEEGFKPLTAICISAFFFAVIHVHYSNTIAIFVLGSFLGYLYYVSGSLWLPIAAHFVNNFLTILLKYLFNIGVISADFTEASMPWYATAISIMIVGACLYLFNKWKTPARLDEDNDDDDDNTSGESELIPV